MTMSGFFQVMQRVWSPHKAPKELLKEIGAERERFKNLAEEYRTLKTWHDTYHNTLGALTQSMEALVWRKDEDHRYILANPLHCEKFFGFEQTPECLDYVLNKTDEELIKDLFRAHGIQNTFGEICLSSDNYTKEMKTATHFIEAGIVDGEEALLYVVKVPQYEGTEFSGTLGIAWDFTDRAEFMISQLNRWIFDKKVVQLYHESDVFCYAVQPEIRKCQIFHHICPDPGRDKTCGHTCQQCHGSGPKKGGIFNDKD